MRDGFQDRFARNGARLPLGEHVSLGDPLSSSLPAPQAQKPHAAIPSIFNPKLHVQGVMAVG